MEKKLTNKIDLLHLKIESLQKAVKRLKQEKEDLKCCGNCRKRLERGIPCIKKPFDSFLKCEEWKFDELKTELRIFEHG